MSETTGVNVLKRAINMEVSPQFDGYSGVRIFVGTNDDGEAIVYEAGTFGGQVLEIRNPFGTQQMANNILAGIQGYQYQPMSAEAAQLNPAAEMGDGVTVNGVYTGIYVRATQFGRLMASDIEAPTDEEIEHEFAVESASDRQYTRFVQQTKAVLKLTNLAIEAEVSARTAADNDIRATLAIQAGEINARVTKTGRNGSNTFAWSLDYDGFFINDGNITDTMKRNKTAKFNFTNTGLKINGEISAVTGSIGGFTIGSTSLYTNNMSSMSSSQTYGVHVGTDGIKLGQNFSVGTDGYVTASGIRLKGSIDFYKSDGTYISSLSANDFYEGAKNGYEWENNQYGSTGYTYADYSLSGAGYGYSYGKATDEGSGEYPSFFKAYSVQASGDMRILNDGSLYIHNRASSGWATESWYDKDGGYHFIRYLTAN